MDKVIRRLFVVAISLQLMDRLAELTNTAPKTIWANYKRRVRRGNPGLTKEYVEEEAVRRMARELSSYTGVHFAIIISEIELEIKRWKTEESLDSNFLAIFEYSFPLYSRYTFASPPYKDGRKV